MEKARKWSYFFYCPVPEGSTATAMFFFFIMGEGKFLMVASPPIWDTPNQELSVFGMKEKLAFDF